MKTKAMITMLVSVAMILTAPLVTLGAQGGKPGPPDGSTDPPTPDYGDLIKLYRDADGVPYLTADGCWQPLPSKECIDNPPMNCIWGFGDPDQSVRVVPVNPDTCAVDSFCATCTQEVDFGRISDARSAYSVFESQLEDVVFNLATADCITLDPAGRLVTSRVVTDEGEEDVVSTSTIDSPLQNLAIYRQLMLTGDLLGAPLPEGAGTLDTAARGLGTGSGKSGEVNVDLVAYLNQIMGLTDPDTTTILDPKLCETYREEVQGTVQLVEKCFLDYKVIVSPENLPYAYDRTANFLGLPDPAYIDDPSGSMDVPGWFEYLYVVDPNVTPRTFMIGQGPITPAVFADELGFLDGNIGGFAQAADDTRAVIDFMHNWPIPDADVFATPVSCVASDDIAYDVSISDVSGLQVPKQMVDGGDGREFFVTVANAGPEAATGTVTVTVTAIDNNLPSIAGSPWTFEFTDLAPSAIEAWTTSFSIALGERTTINWTATVKADDDVNPSNNTATATTSVRVTGGGGGGGGP